MFRDTTCAGWKVCSSLALRCWGRHSTLACVSALLLQLVAP